MLLKPLHLTMACLAASVALSSAVDRYVSTSGSNSNPGTVGQPYFTINYAISQSSAGDTIYVRGGVYGSERVIISGKAGSAGAPITLRSYAGETGIIDMTGITPPNGDGGALEIVNSSHVTVQGLEVRNFTTSSSSKVPIGIFVYGAGTGVKLIGNKVHTIQQNNASSGDAFGIAIKGTAATAIDQIVLDGNEVYNLKTGSSESVALNGNVTNFTVTNNVVHDCNNIGIDFIGYEGTNSNSALDRARIGICSGNTVYNIDTLSNPAYGGSRAAPGIYVDGGQSITIERNLVHHCNYGMSVGSEHAGRFSDSVIVRNNIIRQCHVGGIALGGASASSNGGATNVTITGNTLYQNDTDFAGGGCMEIQNNVSTLVVKNNIMFATADGSGWAQFVLKTNTNGSIASGAINYNIYSGASAANNLEFIWNNSAKTSFTTWKTASGQDANSTFTTASLGFTNAATGDFTLLSTSLARDAGDPAFAAAVGELDFGGLDRIYNGRVDVGADEFGFAPPSSNADLASLTTSAGTLTPPFASATTSYTAIVPEGTPSMTVTPTVAESHAVVRVNGTIVVSGVASGTIPLAVGSNTITILVTAQDTTTTKIYTLTVTRPAGIVDIGVEQPAGTGVIDGFGTKDLGNVAITSTITLTYIVRSLGTDPLTSLAVTKDGTDADGFTINTTNLPATLAPGTNGTFTVTFAPTTTGAKSAAIHITSNDPDENTFDISFVANAFDPRAQMTSPVPGSTLPTAVTTFTWTAGVGVTSYALWIGSALDGYDLYAGNEGMNLSKTLTLPADGRTLYVTLWSLLNGVYQPIKYTYQTVRPVKAQLTSPVNGSTLSSQSVTFSWNTGTAVSGIALWVGTKLDGYDLHAGTELGNSRTVNVPGTGGKVYVTLWSLINGAYQSSSYVFTSGPPQKAVVTSPTTGSTLPNGTLALTWDSGTGVSRYAVWVGSAYGGYDLGALDAGTATNATFTVPQDGGPVYVTLWSLINGAYQSNNDWFITASPASGPMPARLTSPANMSTLSSTTLTLNWDGGTSVTGYALWLGSTPDGYDLYAGFEGTNLTRTLTTPGDGRRLYVTLHSLIGGAYQSNSYVVTDFTAPPATAAVITSPAAGSTLTSTSLPLTWNAGTGVTQYALYVGRAPMSYDLHASVESGTSRTVTVQNDGTPVYVTLWSLIKGAWQSTSIVFITADLATGSKRAHITTPADGAVLASGQATFNWSSGTNVTNYALWIGSSPGTYDLYAGNEGTSLAKTVSLPSDGRKIYVTLYSLISGAYQTSSHVFTAATVSNAKAQMASPANGSILPGSNVTFTWTTGTGATGYALWIGRKPGGYDVYAGAEGLNTSKTITTMPTDGAPVYVTLYSVIGGAYQSNDYIYQAALPQ